jgi:hypothetical protein
MPVALAISRPPSRSPRRARPAATVCGEGEYPSARSRHHGLTPGIAAFGRRDLRSEPATNRSPHEDVDPFATSGDRPGRRGLERTFPRRARGLRRVAHGRARGRRGGTDGRGVLPGERRREDAPPPRSSHEVARPSGPTAGQSTTAAACSAVVPRAFVRANASSSGTPTPARRLKPPGRKFAALTRFPSREKEV